MRLRSRCRRRADSPNQGEEPSYRQAQAKLAFDLTPWFFSERWISAWVASTWSSRLDPINRRQAHRDANGCRYGLIPADDQAAGQASSQARAHDMTDGLGRARRCRTSGMPLAEFGSHRANTPFRILMCGAPIRREMQVRCREVSSGSWTFAAPLFRSAVRANHRDHCKQMTVDMDDIGSSLIRFMDCWSPILPAAYAFSSQNSPPFCFSEAGGNNSNRVFCTAFFRSSSGTSKAREAAVG